MKSTSLCLYCRGALPQKRARRREHVLPRAVTRGFRDNLTIDCVCEECNRYFGQELDRVLVEQTLAAPLRYRKGLKRDTRRAPALSPARLSLSWKDVIFELRPKRDGTDFEAYLPLQIGFTCRGVAYPRYFRLSDLDQAFSDPMVDVRGEVYVVGEGEESLKEARSTLARHGIEPRTWSPHPALLPSSAPGLPPERIGFELRTVIDRTIARCMAKVAFNYLAWVVLDRLGEPSWLMRDDFDQVRGFVRAAHGAAQPRMAVGDDPVVRGRFGTARQEEHGGHAVMVTWQRGDIVARVSLFYAFSWGIELARSFSGILWDLNSAHVWDIETRQVEQIRPRSVTQS